MDPRANQTTNQAAKNSVGSSPKEQMGNSVQVKSVELNEDSNLDQIKKIMEENVVLIRENNYYLRKLWQARQVSLVLRAVYWFLILGATFGAFYFLKPYLGTLGNVYGGGSLPSKSSLNDIQDLWQ